MLEPVTPRTIVHLIDTGGPGGAETIFLRIATGISKQQWHCVPVVPSDHWLADELRRAGADPILVSTVGSFDIRYLWRLIRLLRKYRADLVHTHLLTSSVYGSVAARLLGVPHIATFHGAADLGPRGFRRDVKLRVLFGGPSQVVFVSESLRRTVTAAAGVRSRRTRVIHNGIDSSRFEGSVGSEIRSELGIARGATLIGAIGNVRESKDYPSLLRAVGGIAHLGLPFHLIVVGERDGAIYPDLLRLADELGLLGQVSFLGFRPDVDRILNSLDVFVLSSSTEGFSLSTLEAMAAGVPVVATRSGGPEEIVRDGRTGRLVPPRDPEALGRALIATIADGETARRMAAAARLDVADRFSVRTMLDAYEALYTRLTNGEGSGFEPSAARGRGLLSGAPASILVTDGGERAALAVTRSLGRAGHRVVVTGQPPTLAGASRYAGQEVAAPDPLADPEAFAARVSELVGEERIDVLLPISEASLNAILARRERFSGIAIPFPGHEAFRRASDKLAVAAAAAAAGLNVPEQRVVSSSGELRALASALVYPAVLKPARSIVDLGPGGMKTAVRIAADLPALLAAVAALPPEAYPVLVQRRIVGPGVGVFVLRWEGQTVAAFAHERLREKPPSGGVSVLRVSSPLDESLLRQAEGLLDALGWQGVAMVEFKRDAATGEHYVMEINPRFWGSLQLAIDAGVDFPKLLVEAALGGRPEPVRSYAIGVQTRWLLGDLDHLVARLRHSPRALNLPPGSPGRARAIFDFVAAFRPGIRNEVFRLSDPRPALREAWQWLPFR